MKDTQRHYVGGEIKEPRQSSSMGLVIRQKEPINPDSGMCGHRHNEPPALGSQQGTGAAVLSARPVTIQRLSGLTATGQNGPTMLLGFPDLNLDPGDRTEGR
jgi:hypothetical protein